MLTTAALVPAAPLFAPTVTPVLPDSLAEVRSALSRAVACVSRAEVVVLVAAAEQSGIHTSAHVDLSGLGRPDVHSDLPVPVRASRALLDATGLERRGGRLPLDLAILALHLDRPVVPVAVAADAAAADLADLGRAIVSGLTAAEAPAALAAAGDGSAGLSDRAPRPAVKGAEAWQEAYEAALAEGDGARCVEALAGLGPAEAGRVAARGWPSTVVFAGACATAALALRTTGCAAPRGVGYVIVEAHGAR